MYPAGVPGITVRFVALDSGLTLRVIESGPPKDTAVLLVHGWGGSVYSFAETIPALAAAGHRAIAFDLPGHGLSDKPTDASAYATGAMVDAALGVAKAMGLRRFTYVGHSMGGSIGLELAIRRERLLERLVLIGAVGLGSVPMITPIKLVSPPFVNYVWPSLLARTMVRLVLSSVFGTAERPNSRDVDEYWAPTQFDEFARACRACIHRATWRPIPASELRGLRLPVLVITGGRDRIVRGVAAAAKLIPRARVVHIPEGGHLVMQECADKANTEILQFLRGSPSGR